MSLVKDTETDELLVVTWGYNSYNLLGRSKGFKEKEARTSIPGKIDMVCEVAIDRLARGLISSSD